MLAHQGENLGDGNRIARLGKPQDGVEVFLAQQSLVESADLFDQVSGNEPCADKGACFEEEQVTGDPPGEGVEQARPQQNPDSFPIDQAVIGVAPRRPCAPQCPQLHCKLLRMPEMPAGSRGDRQSSLERVDSRRELPAVASIALRVQPEEPRPVPRNAGLEFLYGGYHPIRFASIP